jgi:hypothetical protein
MAKANKDSHHIRLYHFMLKTSAWVGLSAAARAVYIQLELRYNGSNNGKIAYSVRDAAAECRLNKSTVSRAFKELMDASFIEETRHGGLSRQARIASEWRLTAHKCDLTGGLATRLFMTRGALANANRQPRSRPQTSRGRPPEGEKAMTSAERQRRWRERGRRNERNETLSQSRDATVPIEGTERPKRGYGETLFCPKRGYRKPDFDPSPVPNEGTHIVNQVYRPLNGSADPTPGNTPTPDGALPPNAPSDRPAAQPKLVWRAPVIRELTGAEAIMRRAETLAQEQQK